MGTLGTAKRTAPREQVFDRRGTYVGKVVSRSADAKVVEIELDRQASVEIFGEEVESMSVAPGDLYLLDVLRLDQTIEELRRDEEA